jgi:hypothetical protein
VNAEAAEAFIAELDLAIERIEEAPHQWPPFLANTRRYLLRRFPFFVVFREANDCVQIEALTYAPALQVYSWTTRTLPASRRGRRNEDGPSPRQFASRFGAFTRVAADDPLLELSGDIDGLPEDLSRNFDRYLHETFLAEPPLNTVRDAG